MFHSFCLVATLTVILLAGRFITANASNKPEQIHLSLGENEDEIAVTWVTKTVTAHLSSVVQYGVDMDEMNLTATGIAKKFTDPGPMHRVIFVHRVKLAVQAGTSYAYRVSTDDDNWSSMFTFTAPSASDDDWSPRVAFFGDFGYENAQILRRLTQNVQEDNYDLIIHAGDFAYDLHMEHGRLGDKFMQMIEPLAANVPYMTCPGNHEEAYNFSHYINRFSMPGGSNNCSSLFYSFNLGPAHFIALDTEFYFSGSRDSVMTQYNWLVSDLKEANELENRNLRPWIVVFGHRPMYCSSRVRPDCKDVRIKNALEGILMRYGVDIEMWGHVHGYERLWPVLNFTVKNGTTVAGQPYTNPSAPVHLTSAAAGNRELIASFGKKHQNPPDWSAFQSSDYGFSTLLIHNKTHIQIQFFSVTQDKIIDNILIVKTAVFPSYQTYTPTSM